MRYKFLILCVCLISRIACSQTVVYTLDECLSVGMENNLGLKGAQKEIEISGLKTGTYLDLPNTGIELSQSSTEGGGMDNGLTFSQDFDFPTVYVAKRKVYKAEEKLEHARHSQAVSELRGEIYSVYFSLLYQKAKLGILLKDYYSYSEFARLSRIRFEDGESSKLEYMNAERMKTKIEAQIEDTESSIVGLRLELAKSMGLNAPVDIVDGDIFIIDFGEMPIEFDAVATHSSKVLNAMIDINEKNEWLARQELLPGLSVSATSQLLIKGFNPYNVERERFKKGNFMGFAVGVTVPLFFGSKRAKLITARQETELARIRLEEDMQRQSLEYDNLKNEWALSKKRLDYYKNIALTQAEEFRRLATISYELGEIGYLEYMQNIESSVEIWMEYIDTIDKYNQSLIKIQTLKGKI